MCEFEIPEDSLCFVDSHHGVYVPIVFFATVKHDALVWMCSDNNKEWVQETLKDGCDSEMGEDYWEAWEMVLDHVQVLDKDTMILYSLYQDSDLWLIPVRSES